MTKDDIKRGFSIYLNVENIKILLEAEDHFFVMDDMEGEEKDSEETYRDAFDNLIRKVKAEAAYKHGRRM